MMATNNIATHKEEVLFNSDTLSRIISYLPSIDVLSLSLTSKRFGIFNDDDDSIIKESTSNVVKNLATEEQLAALPHYDGESSLADYHYLQLLRVPLAFDQLVGTEYVNEEDKTCVMHSGETIPALPNSFWGTAFSNNILRAGKHYVTFEAHSIASSEQTSVLPVLIGLIRPGKANKKTSGCPLFSEFYSRFSRHMRHGEHNNNIQCCLYYAHDGKCCTSDWRDTSNNEYLNLEGMVTMSPGGKIGLLLDLDEGVLSVYKNGRELGVIKEGLAGEYCWVVSMHKGLQVTIKRGTIPSS